MFLLLLCLLRFLFFAAWLALEQAVQGAGLVSPISGLVCSCLCFLSSWTRQESICQNQMRDLLPCFFMAIFFLIWEQKDGADQWNNWPGKETLFLLPKEPASAQTAQPGAFCQPLLMVLPLPAQ